MRALGLPAREPTTGVHPHTAAAPGEHAFPREDLSAWLRGLGSGAAALERRTGSSEAGQLAAMAARYNAALSAKPER